MAKSQSSISIVMPCLNEAENLDALLPKLKEAQPKAEILVVNDGSTDRSVEVCQQHGISVVSHPTSLGSGAAIKTGARNATSLWTQTANTHLQISNGYSTN
jgi:glycosyltransferase involved in cell wall biosynthesis